MADSHTPATAEADADAVAYQHGTMPIQEQAATWSMFMGMAKWGSLFIGATLLFLVLWFQPGGSFVAGFIAAAVMIAAGVFFLKAPKKTH